jgi:hypothetical protein
VIGWWAGHQSKASLSSSTSPPTAVNTVLRLTSAASAVASSGMADQSLSEQAREAVLKAIIKSAPTVGNSPTGVRDLAEAYAILERDLVPNTRVVHTRT